MVIYRRSDSDERIPGAVMRTESVGLVGVDPVDAEHLGKIGNR